MAGVTEFVGMEILKGIIGLLWLGVLGVFYMNRSRPLIAQCAPTLTIAANLFNVLALLFDVLIRLLWQRYMSVAVAYVIMAVLVTTPMHCWVAIAASLYIAFNRGQTQVDLIEKAIDDQERARILRKIAFYQKVLQRKTQVFIMLGTFVFFQIPIQIYVFFNHPVLLTTPFCDQHLIPTEKTLLENFSFILWGLDGIVLSVLAVKIRMVVDSLGIKAMLKRVGIGSASVAIFCFMGLPIVAYFSPYADKAARTSISLMVTSAIFWTSIVSPLYRSMKDNGVESTKGKGLEAFLRIPKYAAAFRQHLKSEYSVENLQFWLETDQFESRFEPNSPDHADYKSMNLKAAEIYLMFLRRGSPQEVNLPSKMLESFRKGTFSLLNEHGRGATVVPDVAGSMDCRFDMFIDAKDSVFNLLKADSFERFIRREQYAALWAEFRQQQLEANVMKTLHDASGWSTTPKPKTSARMGTSSHTLKQHRSSSRRPE